MITIEQVLEVLKKDRNFRDIIDQDNYYYSWTGVTFDHLSYDSRDVTPSSLFFAKGAAFKPEFLENAVKAGLSFYVAEKDYQVGIPVIIVTDIKQAMSLVAQAFYQYPQDKLKLLAFTGTKGKTTAAYFAFNILKQSHKPAMLSTMNTTLDGKTFFKSTLTTPESLDLFRINREVRIIVDREEAIKTAMSETTDSKDAVVIAGKGADAFQIVNGKRDNYAGDIEVAKKYL